MVFLCMNYPYSIRVVKAIFSYVGRHSGGFLDRIVDNFFALWMAPGKCRTNPENVGLNPENVGIDRLAKTAESRTSTAFAAVPRARARKQKKQESRNRARNPCAGAPLWGSPGLTAGSPSRLSSPRKAGSLSSPNPSTLDHLCGWSRYHHHNSTAEKSGLQKRSQANRQHSEKAIAGFEPPQEAKSGP